jgi:hypothetical protein
MQPDRAADCAVAREGDPIYAITHAASALLLKRRFPDVPLAPLLVAVQAVELLWVGLTFAGVEHSSIQGGTIHLGFLPYSHSISSGIFIALVAFAALFRVPPRVRLGVAVALGVLSHLVLDLIQHEPDIALLPFGDGTRLGLGLMNWPWLNLAVELAIGFFCVRVFRGRPALYLGVLVFNLANLPTMLQPRALVDLVVRWPVVLPTLILAQIVATWIFVGWGAWGAPKSAVKQPRGEGRPGAA